MDYAIVLYFDKDTEDYFNKIINDIAYGGVNKYMVDVKIPPHITISFFHINEVDNIINLLDENYLSFPTDTITWVSLGAFIPNVLYAAPVLSKYLLEICDKANK